MALFFRSYIEIPADDQSKLTLQQGNPFRDHLLLGAGLLRSSLYKRPKSPDYKVLWIWDDKAFDPIDPYPSEELLLQRIKVEFLKEVERVQRDQQSRSGDHYVIGSSLLNQLGMLYQKSVEYTTDQPELLYHIFLGSSAIDLATMLPVTRSRKHLKPAHLPSELKQIGISPLSTMEQIEKAYYDVDPDELDRLVAGDLKTYQDLYFHLLDF